MKVLVIGGGGREHALAWKLAQSPKVQCVYVAPGNGGTATDARLENVAITDPAALADFAQQEKVALTVVGPEAPLSQGVVDLFRERGLRIFGPTKAAAQLESSKAFSKAFMQRHGIPTARYEAFSDAAAAHAYVDAQGAPIVVKADGLAAGKGVVVAMSERLAHEAIDTMLDGRSLGVSHNDGGARVVIEEYLDGEEASFIVMVDGDHVLALATSQDHKRLRDGDEGPNTGGMGAYSPAPVMTPLLEGEEVSVIALCDGERFAILPPAQDHKRVGDGDTGPNTGGMGAYAPAPVLSGEQLEEIGRTVIAPALAELKSRGAPFHGALFAGLMMTAKGPKVLEFNARLGDPETQALMMQLAEDVLPLLHQCAMGTLEQRPLKTVGGVSVCVVLAAEGYPQAPRTGDRILGLEGPFEEGVQVFHAGVAPGPVTSGGRVLGVCANGKDVRDARDRAYRAVERIRFKGMHFRKDIAARALR